MAVPPIIHAERRVVRSLRQAGATSPGSAQPLRDVGVMDDRALGRLLGAGVVHEASPGRYWLAETAYGGYRGRRRQRAMVILAAVLLVVLVLALLGIIGG